ncbi:unnamed protein product [Onchocerca flexuosa]|uniref:Uncharacterized protein n=1 Tax=Onchocerca flexuosa TaxID=387005 RepID=A0A183HQ74_9BILA|nr:unnamed protein product [Onchocerca flexuosa]
MMIILDGNHSIEVAQRGDSVNGVTVMNEPEQQRSDDATIIGMQAKTGLLLEYYFVI